MATYMVFDVEAIGLHGEAFAVAWVVVNTAGQRLDEGCLACAPWQCNGTDTSREWVRENVPELRVTCTNPKTLRHAFWAQWRRWADQGAKLVADCAWPVEANFLSACVRQDPAEREWQGPYPLHDLASVLLALGDHAPTTVERRPDELPAHHPLMDARHSARQLVGALGVLGKAPTAIMDTRIALGLCAPAEEDFPALYALQGRRVALVDLGPNEKGNRPA